MKKCSKCNIEKEESSFHKRNNRASGLKSSCKECSKLYPKKRTENYMRNYDLMKSYSISHNEYNRMLALQHGECAICGIKESDLIGRKKYLCVDHNHDTGVIRGLICDKCNRGIGLLQDSIDLLEKSILYLKKYQHSPKAVEGFVHHPVHGQVARLTHIF